MAFSKPQYEAMLELSVLHAGGGIHVSPPTPTCTYVCMYMYMYMYVCVFIGYYYSNQIFYRQIAGYLYQRGVSGHRVGQLHHCDFAY